MSKTLSICITLLSLTIVIFSCNQEDKEILPHKVLFYYRSNMGSNDYFTHLDHLIITNYKKGTMRPVDLYKIAKRYVDTVK